MTATRPDLSLVMPCYNEEEMLGYSVPALFDAFEEAGFDLELIAVDNGSTDHTSALIDELAERYPSIRKVVVTDNQGYGHGVLSGYPHCRGRWVGHICADLQVDPSDVVKLFAVATVTNQPRLIKIRRRFRMESARRKVVSYAYNALTNVLFGGLESNDINGTPKILPHEYLEAMRLRSTDWFLDPEIMIKARRMGLPVVELNALSQIRMGGSSNVSPGAIANFTGNLLAHRFGDKRDRLATAPVVRAEDEPVKVEQKKPRARRKG